MVVSLFRASRRASDLVQYGKALKLPKHRLYNTEENAMENLQKNKSEQNKKTQYDYML